MNEKESFSIRIKEFRTIYEIKTKITDHIKIPKEEYSLYYNEIRMESSMKLCTYGKNFNTEIDLKKSENITIKGIFKDKTITLEIYSSTLIKDIKKRFTDNIENLEACEIELEFNNLVLKDETEIFIYNVSNNDEIIIRLVPENERISKVRGFQEVNHFFKMTENLKECKCSQLRTNTVANIIILMCEETNKGIEINKNRNILSEFDTKKSYHHIKCFKLVPSPMKYSTATIASVTTLRSQFSFSGSESSVKSAIWAEDEMIERHGSILIDDKDITDIAKCADFRAFKQLLKDKIGTKCNLRSVTLLYKYTRAVVRYIGFDEQETPAVDRILSFSKKYFKKYFQEEIVKIGGMVAFTLTALDVD